MENTYVNEKTLIGEIVNNYPETAEVLFGIEVDWPQIFDNLASMWEGEYGPWLLQTFYS